MKGLNAFRRPGWHDTLPLKMKIHFLVIVIKIFFSILRASYQKIWLWAAAIINVSVPLKEWNSALS